MQDEVESARTTSRLIIGKLLHKRNGCYPLSPLCKYITPWFCQQSHIHWLLVAKWERRIQLLINVALWQGYHPIPTPTPVHHDGGQAAPDTDPEVTLNFTNISIQQPTNSECTVTNSLSFSIGQCVNVGRHWLGCVAVYLSLKTCKRQFICVIVCSLRSLLVRRGLSENTF